MKKDNLLLEFRLSNLARRLSPRTIDYYDQNLKIFFDSASIESIDQITPTMIRSFLVSKKDLVSPSTLHIYYRVLKRFFNWLFEEEYITINPMQKVKSPKLPKLEPRYLSKNEIKRFFVAIKSKRDYAFFLFLLDTGVRLSEILNLTLDNLDLENNRAFIFGKGSKERYIFFGAKTAKALAKYLFHHRPESVNDLVFVSSSGRPLNPHNVYHISKRISKRANLRGIHPHAFRHTFATQFLENGGNLLVLQRLLGHSSLAMVNLYTHITRDGLEREYKKASPGDFLL